MSYLLFKKLIQTNTKDNTKKESNFSKKFVSLKGSNNNKRKQYEINLSESEMPSLRKICYG